MNYPADDNELEKALAKAFAPPPVANFDAWQKQHSDALAYLNPQENKTISRKSRLMSRTIIFAAAAIVLLCVWLGLSEFGAHGPGTGAFAQVLEQIEKAKTITWKVNFFEHISSEDEKNTWANTEVAEHAYKAPGLYREVRFDKNGQIKTVEINDYIHGRKLKYSPIEKKATIEEIVPDANPSGPFDFCRDGLNAPNLQWVGKQKTTTGEVNIFRHAYKWFIEDAERDRSTDFWIDAKTKQLVATYTPGSDIYDPVTDPARNNQPGNERSIQTAMGVGQVDIRYDVALDDSLFSLEPPQGYAVEVKQRDRITEKEMIDYLGILADFNDKMFPDQAYPTPDNLMSKINRALKKPSKDRTASERKLLETDMHYSWRFGTGGNAPILVFFAWDPDSIVKDSFRYLGKGVKLGNKDRIVCWYKLKDAKDPKTYRVLYGDLSVKDLMPEDLPLPVAAAESPSITSQQELLAQTVMVIEKAETLTSTITTYARNYSEDGKRSWLGIFSRLDIAYQAPNLYRSTSYDNKGKVRTVEITDTSNNKILNLDMKLKKATWKVRPSLIHFTPASLVATLTTLLASKPVEFVGQREVDGHTVNVFRYRREQMPDKPSWDIWLDAKTKLLVGTSDPGSDLFDPATAPDRNNPAEKRSSRSHPVGIIMSNFVYNAPLDGKLFSLTPPEDFKIVYESPPPSVTEADMIEWLEVTARFNDGMFVDTPDGVDHEKQNKIAQMEKFTDVQKRYFELWHKYVGNGQSPPIWNFTDANVVRGTFRYIGKGVKLGDKDRIVCWYKLKDAKDPSTYRVVYGDLSVKDVAPEDLPLPVEP
jgi:outer membrane lipoprotein-sorting protein